MTNTDILIKALDKAIKNGWWLNDEFKVERYKAHWSNVPREMINLYGAENSGWGALKYSTELLFDKTFAKALWGDKCGLTYEGHVHGSPAGCLPNYIYHLQAMVTAEDPIKYLGEHLDD